MAKVSHYEGIRHEPKGHKANPNAGFFDNRLQHGNLYWIEPLLDATEFTISSIDASRAGFSEHPDPKHNGFSGGFAFRPSIDANQYGNAVAIATFAAIAGRHSIAQDDIGARRTFEICDLEAALDSHL